MLSVERSPNMPVVSKVPSLILGMDVSHGSPGQTDIPSIAAVTCSFSLYQCYIFNVVESLFANSKNPQVVSSRQWPLISRYRACVRTQSPKVEMIDSLFKKVSDNEDEGIIR